jgi:predicted anti-sigma-YlaC factor YlaD
MLRPVCRGLWPALAALVVACSPKQIGINRMADALSSTAAGYTKDNDPEFVRLAAPSTLKMVEMLIDQQPQHQGLLLTACSGFTQYAHGFLQIDGEIAQPADASRAAELRMRARRMFERARDYCLRSLEVRHSGIGRLILQDARAAVARTNPVDVPVLYWLGVSWGSGLSLSDNQLTRLGELASVRVILGRAISLDERWQRGAIHEAFIALDGLPPLAGGSAARAREHFERAVALSEGQSGFAYVTMATSVALPARNRGEFEKLLKMALALDVDRRPELRLANLIAQKRARFLLSRVDQLFGARR